MSKNCNNCAWFCHSDQRCYGICNGGKAPKWSVCGHWAADGLSDQEREELDTLVTMEMEE